jgi:galactonate dehydratase
MTAVTPRLSRRSLLASTGSAFVAANTLLGEAIAAENNPAAQVVDRSSTIRVKSLTATAMGAKTYIKIETNHGISGWGEISQLEPKTAAALVTAMFDLIDGDNPTRIECAATAARQTAPGHPMLIACSVGVRLLPT